MPQSQPISGYGFTNLFPGIIFDRPVVVASPPGQTNRLFIAEKSGRIKVIDDLQHPSPSIFLDLSETTYTSVESGLLGFAFHPNFTQNGRFFVYRLINDGQFRDQLLEFRCSSLDATAADASYVKVILSQRDANDGHNAGQMLFGPDGYLYLSLGDNGPVYPDTHETPQAIDKGFFSGIIRIDVDLRPNNLAPNPHEAIQAQYRIPSDNPFIGITEFNGLPVDPTKVRTEFYAIGFRNPWRFCFDPFTGNIVCGDVGEGTMEEVDIVRKGGNYGWPYMEGSLINSTETLPPNLTLPIYEYEHGVGLFKGRVVIGGLVYAGTEFPSLRQNYIFSDYDSGNVWALDLTAPDKGPIRLTGRAGIAAFGLHPADGGVLIANHQEGTIERLVFHDSADVLIPRTLRELGAFSDLASLIPNTNLVPYEVINPLWSDRAAKQRWVDFESVRGRIQFNESDSWDVPAGAVFVKHFELELTNGVLSSKRRIETRVLVKTFDDVYGFTYRWGDSLTNAILVPPEGTNDTFVIHDGGILRTQVWNYPTWDQCRICHNRESGFVLGFRTHQLNRPIELTGQVTNQLAWLAAQGLFTGAPRIDPAQSVHLAALDDPIAPLQHRIRSYLESNCMQCHEPNGRSGAAWDARISTPLAQASILNQPAAFFPAPMKVIAPRDLIYSYILYRAQNRVPLFQMPPIATSVVDDQFINTLKNWILRIPGPDWEFGDIGGPVVEGAAELYRTTLRVSSAGAGVGADSLFFCGRTAFGSTELSARITFFASESTGAEAGLMLRQSLEFGAPAAALVRQGDQVKFMVQRDVFSGYETILSVPQFLISSLKLITDGESVSAWAGDDHGNWRPLAVTDLAIGSNYLAGFAAASGGEVAQFAAAEFNEMNVYSVALNHSGDEQISLPQSATLSAVVSSFGTHNPTVAFRNGSEVVGAASAAPWSFTWTNPPAGELELTATLAGPLNMITSPPVTLHASAPPPSVWLRPLDRRTLGDWSSNYGSIAYIIPGVTNLASDLVNVTVVSGDALVVGPSTNISSLHADSAGIASVFHSPEQVAIDFAAHDFDLHQGALYFRDWLNAGTTQFVTFINPDDQKVLAARRVIASPPAYLPFTFRDHIQVQVRNPAGEAYVTGIFVDGVPSLTVDINSPEDGISVQQPTNLVVTANVTAPNRGVSHIDLWDGSDLLASLTNEPYAAVITNLLTGDHQLYAIAYSSFGVKNQSAPVTVHALPIASAVQFLGTDAFSEGSWEGRYGHDGWWLAGDQSILPRTIKFATDGSFYSFAASTSELPALQRAGSDDRFAACVFGDPEFSATVSALDGQPTTAGFYFLDWGDTHRNIDIVVQAADGTVLDQENIVGFARGKYMFWRFQGTVRFRFISRSVNAVVSAVFFDRSLTPYDIWRNNTFTAAEVSAEDRIFGTADFDGDGYSNALEYYLGTDPRSAIDKPFFHYSETGGWFQISFIQRVEPPDVELLVESSADLTTWAPITPTVITQQVSTGKLTSLNFPAQRQQFIRYSVVAR